MVHRGGCVKKATNRSSFLNSLFLSLTLTLSRSLTLFTPGGLRCDKIMLPLHDFQHFFQRLVLIYVKPFDGRLMFAPVISARGSAGL